MVEFVKLKIGLALNASSSWRFVAVAFAPCPNVTVLIPEIPAGWLVLHD